MTNTRTKTAQLRKPVQIRGDFHDQLAQLARLASVEQHRTVTIQEMSDIVLSELLKTDKIACYVKAVDKL